MSDNLGQPSFASPTIQEAVAEVEREAVHQLPDNHIRLSSGVVLRTKKVSVLRIQAVANKIKPPKLEDYAFYDPDREETILNPNHPEYLRQLNAIIPRLAWQFWTRLLCLVRNPRGS